MAENYIVLRSSTPVTAEGGMAMPTMRGGGSEVMSIEETTLTMSERADLRRDPRTRAIAAPMPLKLIEPTETAEASPVAAGSTWGVDAVGAPTSPFDGSDITVAVLDTGIDPDHEAFQGVTLVQENFTTESDDDQHGHGTHCAGTIFGQDVGSARIGVARNVKRALIGKVLGQGGGTTGDLVKAIQWAVNEGAHVISMSLGFDFPGFVKSLVEEQGLAVEPATSIALEQYRANVNLFTALADMVRAQGLFGQGSIIVAASGNESDRPTFEIAVAPPAAGSGVVAIGALQNGDGGLSVATFSNTQVDVAAPGVGVISARRGGGLVSMNGTSMATPHAAGVAALWAQKQREELGSVEGERLMAQLVARTTTAPLAHGFQEANVGAGLVQAPQS